MMKKGGFKAHANGGIIEVQQGHSESISEYLKGLAQIQAPSPSDLAELVENKETEKYDGLLPNSLLNDGYGAKAFDVSGTLKWLAEATNCGKL